MKALKIQPRKLPEIIEVENTLEALQHEVDGQIEVFYLFSDGVLILGDEEAKIKGSEINRVLSMDLADEILCGDLLILGSEGEEFTGLTDKQIKKYIHLFSERYVSCYEDGEP